MRPLASAIFRALRSMTAAIVVAAPLVSAAHAGPTPEQQCLADRYAAAGKYAACTHRALAKHAKGLDFFKFVAIAAKCTTKYVALWPKLQAKAAGSGSTCDAPRFVDYGNGTVADNLTGLEWEQKTDDGSIHDKDDLYWWGGGPQADGTIFSAFLGGLNAACFASHCDWRLPTLAELLTIVSAPYPLCGSNPCIDPIFGTTIGGAYWSSSSLAADPIQAWFMQFTVAIPATESKLSSKHARGVRSSL
jgi:hypothetical protein